ncbi:FeoB-associated Cys-rich membrane protein [Desulfobulbus rhabdoformis]|uniref:FeoB-associated Cys-rich membrane protein n=1 Tax=Desulfobulbus rhabdoformis TaxID=34032 RepID=UPI00196380E4|nr:FeoB-associated Cys-rich membrane protein [Desulfobulbus rhabdoformis]
MQQIIVVVIVAGAIFFLGRRLYKTFSSGQTPGCGCGCSGCLDQTQSKSLKSPFPMHRP